MQNNLKSLQDKIKDLETKLTRVNDDDSSVVIDDVNTGRGYTIQKSATKGILKPTTRRLRDSSADSSGTSLRNKSSLRNFSRLSNQSK
jgi:hypothetical protein